MRNLNSLLIIVSISLLMPYASAQDLNPGKRIYDQQCLSCHGENGKGTDYYPEPMLGDLPTSALAEMISKTMPEEDPDLCTGEDARLVAEYIYHEFYSPTAQTRFTPARVSYSRLTGTQYRNTVADLIQTFSYDSMWKKPGGLKGHYYDHKNWKKEKLKIERVDPHVQFTFAPKPAEDFETDEFFVVWNGSLFAPVTGTYELIVETPNAFILKVNDTRQALINAKVKSGDDTRYTAAIPLDGGRGYPISLEFYQAKQKENRITLKWVMPNGTEEIIPSRFLSPENQPTRFVLQSQFPPDDRSLGYVRGNLVSAEWDQATTFAALEVTDYVLSKLNRLAKYSRKDDDAIKREKAQKFCEEWVTRAFRRPLTEQQKQKYVTNLFQEGVYTEKAVQLSLLMSLKSPRFLYREVGYDRSFDSFDLVSWLSYTMWDSMPSKQMLDLAKKRSDWNEDQIRSSISQMFDHDRARYKMLTFFEHWLELERFHEMSKDAKLYPEFTPEVAHQLHQSLSLFLASVLESDQADFRELMLSKSLYLNKTLAEIYAPEKIDQFQDQPMQFQAIEPEGAHYSGLLTHPYLMAGFAHNAVTSPIHRGVFVARNVMGRYMKPPPVAIAPTPPDLHASLTTRQRVALQTKPDACMSCHSMINPLGFTLEQFDTIGRFRDQESGKPVNATGDYLSQSGEKFHFTGAADLANHVANSSEAHHSFVERLFQHMTQQPVRGFSETCHQELVDEFASRNFSIRELQQAITLKTILTLKSRPKSENTPALSQAP